MVANPQRKLDASGYPVSRGTQQDELSVPVPRCAGCRSRNRLSAAIVLGGTVSGAIILPILQSLFWPQLTAPGWLIVSHEGIGNLATGIGAVLGFAAALLGVVLHRRLSGIRSLNAYPPVVTLRQTGWRHPA
ncbi:hypothetical protein [Bradyrhizobium canariense]|uniref:Uncharacterized protein n=1 Tax=Bradyrhizobium canariense TaxID=255045 RepID=A0A1H1VVU1_9BRAD|nr:hypothetical protein [Bradyrhizobium canariense]SDS88366.1 hypothetical protein SAMN05444158_3557 [Bradyrhizobium canariense]